MRSALGSSRARVVRQLLIEALLLSAGASLLGLALSVAGVRLFARETIDMNLPYWIAFEFDARVFSYVALVCVATAVVFGLAPAWQLSRTDAGEILKEGARGAIGGRSARRWSAALLVGELALTMMLLAAAGQLARNGISLYRSDAQLDLDGLLAASLALPPARYDEPENRRRLQRQLQERLDGISPISSATLASARPFMGATTRRLVFAGETAEAGNSRLIESIGIGDRYFETLNLPLLQGRTLSAAADAADREVVINERLAELFFHGADPIGRQIQLLEEGAADSPSGRWLTIVGIVPSVRQRLIGPATAAAYTSLASDASGGTAVLLRGSSDSASLAATLRRELHAIDVDLAAYSVTPLRRSSEISRFIPRFVSAILVTLGVIASVLSAGGLFGVTAMGITQRTVEVGLRMAVGARPVQIAWLFLRRTSILVCVGLAIGLAGALALNQTLQAAVVGTRSTDAVVIAAAVLFLAVTAVIASLLPIRRATRLDPVAALRHE